MGAAPSSTPGREGVFLGGESTEEQERAKATAPQAVSEDLLCAVAQAQSWSRESFILPQGRQGECAGAGRGLGVQGCAVGGSGAGGSVTVPEVGGTPSSCGARERERDIKTERY